LALLPSKVSFSSSFDNKGGLVVSREVFILGGKRTPMGEYVGALKDVSAMTWASLPRAVR
jgi:hypothetical protein